MDTKSITLLALFATLVGLVVALVGLFLLRGIIHYTQQMVGGENPVLGVNQPTALRIGNMKIGWHRVERTSTVMMSVLGVASAMVLIQMLSML
jgi:hypothetical protein